MGISMKGSGLSFKVLFCDRLSIMEHSQKLNWFCNIITYFNYNACYKAHIQITCLTWKCVILWNTLDYYWRKNEIQWINKAPLKLHDLRGKSWITDKPSYYFRQTKCLQSHRFSTIFLLQLIFRWFYLHYKGKFLRKKTILKGNSRVTIFDYCMKGGDLSFYIFFCICMTYY